jgi:hypothetical protein
MEATMTRTERADQIFAAEYAGDTDHTIEALAAKSLAISEAHAAAVERVKAVRQPAILNRPPADSMEWARFDVASMLAAELESHQDAIQRAISALTPPAYDDAW